MTFLYLTNLPSLLYHHLKVAIFLPFSPCCHLRKKGYAQVNKLTCSYKVALFTLFSFYNILHSLHLHSHSIHSTRILLDFTCDFVFHVFLVHDKLSFISTLKHHVQLFSCRLLFHFFVVAYLFTFCFFNVLINKL